MRVKIPVATLSYAAQRLKQAIERISPRPKPQVINKHAMLGMSEARKAAEKDRNHG